MTKKMFFGAFLKDYYICSSLLQVTPALKQKTGLDVADLDPADAKIAKGLLLSIAFAANIGGTGTITGTPPNLVLVDQFNK